MTLLASQLHFNRLLRNLCLIIYSLSSVCLILSQSSSYSNLNNFNETSQNSQNCTSIFNCNLENNKKCKNNEYFSNSSSNNEMCHKCSDKFGPFCDECSELHCSFCIGENVEYSLGMCYCKQNSIEINFSCVLKAVIFGPLIFALLIILIIIFCWLHKKKNSLIIMNSNTARVHATEHNTEYTALRKLVIEDNLHNENCVFGDANPPFWKLNCGGYICNDCSLNVLMSITENSENKWGGGNFDNNKNVYKCKMSCPKCHTCIEYFNFVNRLQLEGQLQNNLSIMNELLNININENEENNPNEKNIDINNAKIIEVYNEKNIDVNKPPDSDDFSKCNICFSLPNKKIINCSSLVPHMLCTYCYKRLILLERIKLCPFCRAIIKN